MQQYRKNLGKVSLTAEGAWNLNDGYDILSIVYDEHTQHGFISRKAVPQGVDLYNKEYWMPFNVSGYADNNVIILSKKTSEASIQSYTLEEAITNIKPVGRRPGAILGFYNENNDRLDIGGRWELWQFNSTTISEWEDVNSWTNIYYNYNKFVGWYKSEDYLKKHFPFPEIGCYAFVGTELNEASVYRCDNKYVWNNTTQHAWDYIKVIVDGNVTVGKNGNWFNNGEDTGIPASVKGENGKTPIIRNNDNVLEVSYDNVNWEPISDEIAVWLRVNNNKLEMTKNKSGGWEVVSDYISAWFRWQSDGGEQITSVGKIQITRDGVSWTDLSGNFVNHLRISKYIGAGESLPTSGIAEGTIYAKGPTYDTSDTSHSNPIYRLWVYAWKDNTLAWQDNGEFTSIAAGIVQEVGENENVVMSQKAVSGKLSELASEVYSTIGNLVFFWEQGTIENGDHADIGFPAGSVNANTTTRICSKVTGLKVGSTISYNIPQGYNLAILDWDGVSELITHTSGWLNRIGEFVIENTNVFFVVSKENKDQDITIEEGNFIDITYSGTLKDKINNIDHDLNGTHFNFWEDGTVENGENIALGYGAGSLYVTEQKNRISSRFNHVEPNKALSFYVASGYKVALKSWNEKDSIISDVTSWLRGYITWTPIYKTMFITLAKEDDSYIEVTEGENVKSTDSIKYRLDILDNKHTIAVDFWGDSLTQSVNESGKSYPSIVGELLDVKTNCFGNGGEVAIEIAGRQGGCPMYLYEDVIIPSSGSIEIKLKSTYNDYIICKSGNFLAQNNSGINPCKIGNVVGNISYDNSVESKIVFTRINNGNTELVKAGELVYSRWESNTNNNAQVIFVGQNNMGSLDTDEDLITVIKNMIDYYNNNKYIVICPIQRSNVDSIIKMEQLFKKNFGNKCLCLREYLNHYGIKQAIKFGFIQSATNQDNSDIQAGLVPSSLRQDSVHLNYYGYYILADKVAELLKYNQIVQQVR